MNDIIQKYIIYINPSVRFVYRDEYCNTFNYLTYFFWGGRRRKELPSIALCKYGCTSVLLLRLKFYTLSDIRMQEWINTMCDPWGISLETIDTSTDSQVNIHPDWCSSLHPLQSGTEFYMVATSGIPSGGSNPPPPKFRRPSKIMPNSTRLWKLLKIAEFRMPTPQDVWRKGSKILKLPRFAIVLH